MKKEQVIRSVIALVAAVLITGVLMYIANRPEPAPEGTTYTAEAQGFGGPVTVAVTMDGSTITGVEITGEGETAEIGGAAMEELASQIMSAQSADIDGVTGASMTSGAVKEAAAAAIAQAGG